MLERDRVLCGRPESETMLALELELFRKEGDKELVSIFYLSIKYYIEMYSKAETVYNILHNRYKVVLDNI